VYSHGQIVILDPMLKNTRDEIEINTLEYYELNLWSYFIQEQLGETLESIINRRNAPFSFKTSIQIGCQLLEQYKLIHASGYIHNDLKLENILVGKASAQPDSFVDLHRVTLIDFGLCTMYLDQEGKHVPKKGCDGFQGNMIFASRNAFIGKTLSRRDDLISLCYFLIYIIDGSMPFIE
jgi:serine/threonine protein kinase